MPDNLNPTAVPTTSAIGQPVRFRGGGFTVKRHPWAALAAFAVLIALWEGASRLGLASPLFLPPPSAVGHALAGMVMDGSRLRAEPMENTIAGAAVRGGSPIVIEDIAAETRASGFGVVPIKELVAAMV